MLTVLDEGDLTTAGAGWRSLAVFLEDLEALDLLDRVAEEDLESEELLEEEDDEDVEDE